MKLVQKQHYLYLKILLKMLFLKKILMNFKVPENIYLTSLNYDTGFKSSPGEKNSIIEALKLEDINNLNNNNLISISDRDNLIKFRQFY